MITDNKILCAMYIIKIAWNEFEGLAIMIIKTQFCVVKLVSYHTETAIMILVDVIRNPILACRFLDF